MEVTDLMVGDRVQKLEVGGHYRRCRIKAIIDNTVDCETSDGEVHTLSVSGIEPIPLTTEILEKNFRADKQWGENGWFVNDHIHIYQVTTGVYNIQYMEIVDIRHVHELQHALKLCGIEKSIEL